MSPIKDVVLTEPYFKCVSRVLKTLGIWRISLDRPTLILSLCHMFASAVSLILMELVYICLDIDNDYTEVLKTFGTMLFHVGCTSRMFHFFYCVQRVPEILGMCQRKSFNFENLYVAPIKETAKEDVDKNQVIESEEAGVEMNKIKKKYDDIMKYYRLSSFALFWMLMITAVISLSFSYIGAMLIPERVFDGTINETVKEYRLPYSSYHFLDVKTNKGFYIEIGYQCYAITFMSACILTVDSFFYGIVIHATGQCVVLQMVLENTVIYRDKKRNHFSERQINRCIEESVEIANISYTLQDMLENVFLLQYTLAVFIICVLIYVVETADTSLFKLVGYVVFLFIVSFEVLITCIVFQGLTTEYAKLADSFYFLNWYEATPSLRKKLTIAMAGLQKPLVIKIFHLVSVNTDMFTKVMKMAYSFYTLISQTR